MTKSTLAAAVKRSGVSLTTFNNRYVKTGLITVFVESGKKYVATAELTEALAKAKPAPKKAVSKSKAKVQTKPKTVAKPKTIVKPKAVSKTEAVPLSDVAMLKLQIKQLKAELKKSGADNALLLKQNESLNRKNASLTRRLSTSKDKSKPQQKSVRLSLPEPASSNKSKPRTAVKNKPSATQNWVDKWWERF